MYKATQIEKEIGHYLAGKGFAINIKDEYFSANRKDCTFRFYHGLFAATIIHEQCSIQIGIACNVAYYIHSPARNEIICVSQKLPDNLAAFKLWCYEKFMPFTTINDLN